MKTLTQRLKKAADLALLMPPSRLGHAEGVRITGPHKAPAGAMVYYAEAGGIQQESISADAALDALILSLREKAIVAQRARAEETMKLAGDALEVVSRIEKDEDLRDLLLASKPIPAAPAPAVAIVPEPSHIRPDLNFVGTKA